MLRVSWKAPSVLLKTLKLDSENFAPALAHPSGRRHTLVSHQEPTSDSAWRVRGSWQSWQDVSPSCTPIASSSGSSQQRQLGCFRVSSLTCNVTFLKKLLQILNLTKVDQQSWTTIINYLNSQLDKFVDQPCPSPQVFRRICQKWPNFCLGNVRFIKVKSCYAEDLRRNLSNFDINIAYYIA